MPMHPEVANASVIKYLLPYAGGIQYYTRTPFGDGTLPVQKYTDKHWDLGQLFVYGENHRGIGTHLVQAFVVDAGPDTLITSAISHDATRHMLLDRGFDERALHTGGYMVPTGQIHDLPIVKLMRDGGIRVDTVVLKPTTELHRQDTGFPFAVYCTGSTLRLPRIFPIIDMTDHS